MTELQTYALSYTLPIFYSTNESNGTDYYFFQNVWQLPDDCLTTAKWLPDDYLTIAWWLQQLLNDSLTTVEWLPDDCLTTAWQLFDECLKFLWD